MKTILYLGPFALNEEGAARLMSVVCDTEVRLVRVSWTEQADGIYKGGSLVSSQSRPHKISPLVDQLTLWRSVTRRSLQLVGPDRRYDLILAADLSRIRAALSLKWGGQAKRVVGLICDYQPPCTNYFRRLYRQLIWRATLRLSRHCDAVWRLTPRIPIASAAVAPVPVDQRKSPRRNGRGIAYVGCGSAEHMIGEMLQLCRDRNEKAVLVGSSSYLETLKRTGGLPGSVSFFPATTDAVKLDGYLAGCSCGWAAYRNTTPKSYTWYGFPSKALQYLGRGLPVITTHTGSFAATLEEHRAGAVAKPEYSSLAQATELTQLSGDAEQVNRFCEEWNRRAAVFYEEQLARLLK